MRSSRIWYWFCVAGFLVEGQQEGTELKAWVLYGINDLRLQNVEAPKLKSGEVLVHVKAAGICGSDIARIYRTGAHVHPLVPGHEFSGIVEEVGKGVDGKWQGRRVGVFPLVPCKKCQQCRDKMYELCQNYGYLGSRQDGGFAEYVAVLADNLVEIPNTVSYEEAAMLEPMAVAVHAMRRASIRKGDTVVICGGGTIGTALLMFLMEAGIKDVLMIGNKGIQKKTAVEMGLPASQYCDITSQDALRWVKERANEKGANICFECVGKSEVLNLLLESAAPAGQIVLVGNPYSDMLLSKELYWKILRKQLRVTGTWNSSFTHERDDDWHYVLNGLAWGRISPARMVSHRYPLEKMEDGLGIMRNKAEEYMKIMIV